MFGGLIGRFYLKLRDFLNLSPAKWLTLIGAIRMIETLITIGLRVSHSKPIVNSRLAKMPNLSGIEPVAWVGGTVFYTGLHPTD